MAFDADSRRLAPAMAAARHHMLLETRYDGRAALFKKIDSTLRGQPAAELAETIRLLRERGHGALSVVAPAFPATGRTTVGGRLRLHGQALEDTPLWARDHSYPSADLVAVLEAAGLRVRLATLDVVRAGPDALAQFIRHQARSGLDAVVCDAATPGDLDIVARATLPLAGQVFWTGSAGLAQALARAATQEAAAVTTRVAVRGGILFVVGSIAEASRAAAAMLATDGALLAMAIAPATLRAGPVAPEWRDAACRIAGALAVGGDVLVEIATDLDADLSQGADLARRLAALLQPAAPHIGALFATGGETALALLNALGVSGIRLLDEIEPGVPIGMTRGALTVPIITKAGAFGDAGTLSRCLSTLRRSRPTETPP